MALVNLLVLFDNSGRLCNNAVMINLLLVWLALPVLAQESINPAAVLERIAPMVSAAAPGYDLFQKANFIPNPKPILVQGEPQRISGTPLIDPGIWATLQPPEDRILQWISSRIPGINISQIRAMPISMIDSITGAAMKDGETSVTLLTDKGLTTPHIFYLSQEVIKSLFTKYHMGAMTSDSGVTNDGQNFNMLAMLLGNNRVQVLYDWDNFEFTNPDYPDYPLILNSLVTFSIKGSGYLGVNGVKIDAGIVTADIQTVRDLRNGSLWVETSRGSRLTSATPITLGHTVAEAPSL